MRHTGGFPSGCGWLPLKGSRQPAHLLRFPESRRGYRNRSLWSAACWRQPAQVFSGRCARRGHHPESLAQRDSCWHAHLRRGWHGREQPGFVWCQAGLALASGNHSRNPAMGWAVPGNGLGGGESRYLLTFKSDAAPFTMRWSRAKKVCGGQSANHSRSPTTAVPRTAATRASSWRIS
jgi:hypothetical protein